LSPFVTAVRRRSGSRPLGLCFALCCSLLVTLWLIAPAGCATVGPPDDGRPVLDSLHFSGNQHLSSSELEDRIATTPSSGFFKKVLRTWDADLFEIDRQRLERYYRMRGFFEATVDEPKVELKDDKHVAVSVEIHEGRRSSVSAVRLLGLDALSDDERYTLHHSIPLQENNLFDETLFESDKTVLATLLKEHGFAAVECDGEANVAIEKAQVELVLTCQTGQRFKIGKVKIVGNRAIPVALIEKSADLERDQQYAPSRLALAQQRVYNLGVFSGVRVGLEPLGDDPVAAVRVTVREAPFHTVRFGVGAQFEESRMEIPRLRLEYTHRNFLGGARRLELSTQVGYAFIPSVVDFTSPGGKNGIVTLSSAQLTLPQAFFGLDVVGRGEFASEKQVGFDYDQISARAALLLRRGKWSFAGSFNFVRTFNADLDLDLSTVITNQGGTAAAALANCVPACSLPYPELRVTFDARDDIVEPRLGLYASASIAHTLPGTTFNYWKLDPEVRFYFPLGPNLVVAARAQWGGLIQPPGADALSTPFIQRFFGGGQNQNRGYAPQQQGPRLGASPVGGYATGAVPIGGNGMVIASLELRIHIDALLKNAAIVPFVDASRVTDFWYQTLERVPEFAPGLGLRYLTPFGPVRFDVGVLVNPETVTTTTVGTATQSPATVSANCGSQPHCLSIPRFAYHLTLGEAF
jgi:translocation and assembly module TamA